jgi:transposase
MSLDHHFEEPTAIRTSLGAIFVSLLRSWRAFRSLVRRHSHRRGNPFRSSSFRRRDWTVSGFIGRCGARELRATWSMRRRLRPHVAGGGRRPTGSTARLLVRALLAYKRGEPRVCAMVRAPTPEDEDSRRVCRERKTLTVERIQHVNRIKGLLFSQGVSDYEPLRRDRRQRLDELRTGDGRPLPPHLKIQISRELDRLELLIEQIKAVETERDALSSPTTKTGQAPAPRTMLIDLRGIGPEFAAVLWSEGLHRNFANRKQVASYAGLAPTPWQSGSVAHEQGVSKAGNPRLRTTMIQLAWLWLRHQPDSALARWFHARVKRNGGRLRKTTIVALARKLLVALWKYVTAGVVIEGAIVKRA